MLSQPASHHSWRCGCLPAGDWQAANGKPVPLLVQGQTLRQELTGKLMQIDANYLNAVIKLSWQLIWFKHTSAMKWSSFKMDTRGKWQKPCRSESDMRGMLAPPVRLALPSMFFVVGKGLQMEQIQGNTIRPCRSTKPTESKRPNFPLLESSWIQGKWIIINQCLCHGAMILQDHPIFSKFQLEALTQ